MLLKPATTASIASCSRLLTFCTALAVVAVGEALAMAVPTAVAAVLRLASALVALVNVALDISDPNASR